MLLWSLNKNSVGWGSQSFPTDEHVQVLGGQLSWRGPESPRPSSYLVLHPFHLAVTELNLRRQRQPTPVFLLGKFHGRRAWWAAVHGVARSQARLSDFIFTFHFHELEKEMATHSSTLAWRIPGTGEPGGLPSLGSHRVGHDWSDLVVAAAAVI